MLLGTQQGGRKDEGTYTAVDPGPQTQAPLLDVAVDVAKVELAVSLPDVAVPVAKIEDAVSFN
jgi:hypothetical protein